MKLTDLIRPISDMSDEELHELVRKTRHNREILRPAHAKIIADVEKKASRARVSNVDKLIGALTPEQKLALMKQLQGDQ